MKKEKFLLVAVLLSLSLVLCYYFITLVVSNSESDIDPLSNFITNNNIIVSNQYESPISIKYLRTKQYSGSDIQIEEQLVDGSNYHQYIASYISDGFKIYGLLTVPFGNAPEGGFSAIVFNHGYIPPREYKTTEKYVAYVDSLARNGFIVFKIDLRGHGNSEGRSTGTYFSNSYTIDALNAVSSLRKLDYVNSDKIGLWGHSMAGNLVLRALLIDNNIKAGVIWAGAVYSYEDFSKYRISDSSYRGTPSTREPMDQDPSREVSQQVSDLRNNAKNIDFEDEFWSSISLTKNIDLLNAPIQLNHSKDDDVVNVNYSIDLSKVLEESGKTYEMYLYDGGGHNINSPYFEQAMKNTISFYNKYLK